MWEIVEKKQSRGRLLKGAQSSIDLSDIKALVNAITSLLEVFQVDHIFMSYLNLALTVICSSKAASPLRSDLVSSWSISSDHRAP